MTKLPKTQENIIFYHKNIIASSYKKDEETLSMIVKKNIFPTDTNSSIKLQIYYKSKCISILFIQNECSPWKNMPQEAGLIYCYTCYVEGCTPLNKAYIRSNLATLLKQLAAYLQNGSIKRDNPRKKRHNTYKKAIRRWHHHLAQRMERQVIKIGRSTSYLSQKALH